MPAKRSISLGGLLAVALATASASAQCTAPATWFPHTMTLPPSTADPGVDPCKFHQWSWQTFLWLTQTVDGDLRLLTQMYSRDDLFELKRSGLKAPDWKL